MHHFNFKSEVYDVKFSPDGKYFAVAAGRMTEVWRTPQVTEEREFAPFVKHREYTGHYDDVNQITWSSDSRFFLTASKDMAAKIFSVDPIEGFIPTALGGHKDAVVGTYFSADQETIYTVSKDGALFQWQYKKVVRPGEEDEDEDMEDEEDSEKEEDDPTKMRWQIVNRHYFNQNNAKLRCATFHPQSNLLVAGFTNGVFGLYELPEFNMIHTLR